MTPDLPEIAARLGYPYAEDLERFDPDPSLLSRIPREFALSRKVLPLRIHDGSLVVATAQPLDILLLDEVRGIYGHPLSIVVTPPDPLATEINRLYSLLSTSAQEVVQELEGEDLSSVATALAEPKDLLDLTDDAPVIRLLNSILFQAVKERASDIHIEPFERDLIVRYRIDGILYQVLTPPKLVQDPLTSRVKIMAGLDIAEKRLPQDGRIRVIVAGREVDIRVSTVPTAFGERIVLRILDKQRGIISLSSIGLSPRDERLVTRILSRTSGMVLVTGPTGSGKTTTLYAMLTHLNSPEKNIITIEDPIEYQLHGVGQIPVNPKIDLTFANGLRSILRQDPDIIMVGEIRDTETAEIAMQSSLTGHLVLSTLHTNDAATAVTRLIDMGIEPFLVASTLSCVIAQRLVRRICPHCRVPYHPDPSAFPDIRLPDTLYRGAGCDRCFGHGTMGRVAIYEILAIDPEIVGMIVRRTPASAIKEYALSRGMKSLREDGLDKVAEGTTTLEEVMRVTQDDYADLSV